MKLKSKLSQNCLDAKDIKTNAANQISQIFLLLPRVIILFPVSDIDTWKKMDWGLILGNFSLCPAVVHVKLADALVFPFLMWRLISL